MNALGSCLLALLFFSPTSKSKNLVPGEDAIGAKLRISEEQGMCQLSRYPMLTWLDNGDFCKQTDPQVDAAAANEHIASTVSKICEHGSSNTE